MKTAEKLILALRKAGNRERANNLSRFFKTGKGQYGEGDRFLGLTVPATREIIKKFLDLSLKEIQNILKSPYHEARLAGVLVLVSQYKNADSGAKKKIFNFYIKNAACINNWDLVDLSSPHIVGEYITNHMNIREQKLFTDRGIRSTNLWMNRITMLATFYPTRQKNNITMTLYAAEKFFNHTHDLMHKAVGWMLREAAKQDKKAVVTFLKKNGSRIPRTTLRYAIERFDSSERAALMRVKFLGK